MNRNDASSAPSSLHAAFAVVSGRVEKAVSDWRALSSGIAECLGEGAARNLALGEATARIETSRRAVAEVLERPMLYIATTGTTSGGKSAIVNYLAGAELMPISAQEMSQGSVELKHNAEPSLTVKPTNGAIWPTGPRRVRTAEEIQLVLTETMTCYRANRDRGMASPSFDVGYPTRFGAHVDAYGLPPASRVVLLDLPGLNFVGDDINGRVIVEMCKRALCLVIINSEATDPKARAELVTQVVDEVRKLGGSPARMLFVANRFDAFQRDRDPAIKSEEFRGAIEREIRERIATAFPEHTEAANRISVMPFSSAPALYARLMTGADRNIAEKSVDAAKHHYAFFLPPHLVAEAYGPRKNTRDVRENIAEALLSASHAHEFEQKLQRHIAENVPSLLLPQALEPVRDAINGIVRIVDSELKARRASVDGRCDEELARLDSANGKLDKLRVQIAERVLPLRSFNERGSGDVRERLAQAALQTARATGLGAAQLDPLVRWIPGLSDAAQDLINEVKLCLEGRGLEGPIGKSLMAAERAQIIRSCEELVRVGYGSSGGSIRLKGDVGKARLVALCGALRALGQGLVGPMHAVLRSRASTEADSIVAALQCLLERQNSALIDGAAALAPELRSIQRPSMTIDRVDSRLHWVIDFRIDPSMTKDTRTEKTDERHVTHSKRLWYYLWLVKEEWVETIPIYTDVDYHTLNVPSTDDLCAGIFEQFRASKPEVTFLTWLHEQLDAFDRRVKDFHEACIQDYRTRIGAARGRVVADRDAHRRDLDRLDRLAAAVDESSRMLKWDA